MAFTLDTSSAVIDNRPGWAKHPVVYWFNLDAFAQGYIEAMFESSLNMGGLRKNEALCGFADLAPETLARIIADCEAMERHLRRERMSTGGGRAWELRQSGFWPKTWPPLTVALDDTGKIVFS